MSRKPNTCVTFDLWETLIADQSALDITRGRMRCEGIDKVLQDSHIRIPLNKLEEAYEKTDPLLDMAWTRDENPTPIEQVQLIVTTATGGKVVLPNDPQTLRKLEAAYVDPILISPPKLKAGAAAVLNHVRGRVDQLGLISNTGRSPGTALRKVLSNYGILQYFDSTIFSNETGTRKPNRRIFEIAGRELKTDLSKIIHIGDNPEADIWGAKQAGMKAVLLEYELPQEFRERRTSLFTLSRIAHIPASEIRPDARIKSLDEVPGLIDSMM